MRGLLILSLLFAGPVLAQDGIVQDDDDEEEDEDWFDEDEFETDFEDDEPRNLSAGPALYFNHNDTIHSRIEWKYDLVDHQGILDHGNGNAIKLGMAWVF